MKNIEHQQSNLSSRGLRRKRIMVVTPRFPLPLIGGDRIRIYNICRELARNYDLDLFSLTQSEEEGRIAVDPQVFKRVERFRLSKWRSCLGIGGSILRREPMQVGYFNHSGMHRRLEEVADQYDAVLAHLIRVVPMLPDDSRLTRIIEMTDAISLNYQRIAQHRKFQSIKSVLYAFDERPTFQFERRCVRNADIASLISRIDAEYLTGNKLPSNVVIASNGVNVENYPMLGTSDLKSLLYLGNMGTEQNLDAVQYMADEVMTELIKDDFSLRVVGTISETNAAKLRDRPGVVLTGRVAELPPAVAGCSIAVAPIRIGAGVQNKVLEYMAFGIPSVISSVAAEGLAVENGVHTIIANSPAEIAIAIRRLWNDRTLRECIGTAGRTLVEETYSWRAALAPFSAAVDRVLR